MKTVTIGRIAQQLRGVSYAKGDATDAPKPGFSPILRANNIGENGLNFDSLVYVPDSKIKEKQRIQPGDVVIAASSGSLEVVGKAARAVEPFDGAFGAFCKVLRPNSDVDPAYFAHFFKTKTYRQRISSLAAGANINNLKNEHLDDFEIPLPPLAEQKRIAAILDAADELRTKRRESLSQLDTLLQSTFLDLFGDPERKGWQMATVEHVADDQKGSIRTGPFGSQMLTSEFVDSGIAVLGIDNAVRNEFQWGERRFITPAKYRQLERYTVQPGDVLITIMGTCGRCAIVPEDIPTAINTKHLCCITLNRKKCVPTFLHSYFLLHPVARQYLAQTAKGAIMSGLNMGIIKAMPIPIAPLSLQKEYSELVSAVEQQKQLYRAQFDELNTLFASLQSRAFRGEL
jgi:type I restriction enzyme S subunit